MRKIFITLVACLFMLASESKAQLTVTMSSVTVDQNAQASVDITVSGFTNLLGVQFSMNFDSLVVGYANATNFTASLPGLSSAAVSGPNGVGVKNGQITFSWFDQQGTGKSLPNGTRLFTLVFNAIGPKCSKSDIVTSNVPRMIEVVDAGFNNINLINVKGTVTVKCDGPVDPCPNPTCNNQGNLMIFGQVLNAQPNATVCVPIRVKNFKIMQSGQGSFTWNPALLMFTEFKTPSSGGITMFAGGINSNNVATGQLGFVWSNPDPGTPLTLADSTMVIELCFKVIGAVDQTACVLMGQGTIPSEWTNNNGEVGTCFTYGKIKIVSTPPQGLVIIKAANTTGKKDSVVCVDITVDGFTKILGFNTTFSWDPTKLEFIRTDMYNLEGLNNTAFANTSSTLKVLWISQNPITKPDGHKIFQICFKLIGPCDSTAAVNIPGPTEVVGDNSVIVPSSTVAGSIKITCDTVVVISPVCTLGVVTTVKCNGGSDGSVALSVTGTGTSTGCNCLWKNAAGTIVKASGPVSGGCNLTGVSAGTYTYEVSCGGIIKCTGTATVNQPTVITIPTNGVVVNVGCGQKGSITIAPTGGTPGYSYSWTPALGDIPNPKNLDAGTYVVTVSDVNKCTATASFTVGNTQTDLTVTSGVVHVKCKGESTGSIQLNISGGCPPSSITWTGGLTTASPQNVKAGTYTATVTDSSVPAQTKTVTVVVNEPADAVSITLDNIANTTGGLNNGAITLTILGGTPNYKTMWSGGIADGNTTKTITVNNLAAGNYSVTVTDANGCTAVRTNMEVKVSTPAVVAPIISGSSVTSNFNSFGVACFGGNKGSVQATVSAGTPPLTAVLKSGTQTVKTANVVTNQVQFTDLTSGTYTIEITNSAGTVVSTALVITQPSKLAGTPLVKCSEKNGASGSIEMDMKNTGVAPYSFSWFGLTATGNKVDGLGNDVYNVTITDGNGCETKVSNIEVKDCDDDGGECYTSTTVITPNGDNLNDLFIIKCVNLYPSDLTVFDRWGRVVYSHNNYDNSWQGVDNNGADLKESAYLWVLTVNFGQGRREVQKGSVTILRNK